MPHLARQVPVDSALIGKHGEMTGLHGSGRGRPAGGGERSAVGGIGVDAVAAVHEVVAKVVYLEGTMASLVFWIFLFGVNCQR